MHSPWKSILVTAGSFGIAFAGAVIWWEHAGIAAFAAALTASVIFCFIHPTATPVNPDGRPMGAVRCFLATAGSAIGYGAILLILVWSWESVRPNVPVQGGGRGRALLRLAKWLKGESPDFHYFLAVISVGLICGGLWRYLRVCGRPTQVALPESLDEKKQAGNRKGTQLK